MVGLTKVLPGGTEVIGEECRRWVPGEQGSLPLFAPSTTLLFSSLTSGMTVRNWKMNSTWVPRMMWEKGDRSRV